MHHLAITVLPGAGGCEARLAERVRGVAAVKTRPGACRGWQTLVLVTHDTGVASRARRVGLMGDGRLTVSEASDLPPV
jgi:predicted ABC-type transport system involved in lysophospholipase L1 biosynthesis ATPase subunit